MSLIFCGLSAFQAQPWFLPQDVSINFELGLSVALGGALDAIVAVIVAVCPSPPPLML